MKGAVSNLSDSERQIALLAAEGLTDKEIQRQLGLSASTVATYWKRIREKLQCVNRAEAMAHIVCGFLAKPVGIDGPLRGMYTATGSAMTVTLAPGDWPRSEQNGGSHPPEANYGRHALRRIISRSNGASTNGSHNERHGPNRATSMRRRSHP